MTTQKTNSKPPRTLIAIVVVIVIAGVFAKFTVFAKTFRYAGTVEATKVDLSSQVSSTLSKIYVHEGDHIKENQPLVELSCSDMKVASELAQVNYDRNLRLLKAGTASQETFDQVKNKKEDADVRLQWCNLQSPISGSVLSRYHEPGELVVFGTKLLTLANIKDVWAYIYVPQPDVFHVKAGLKVTARLPEMPGRTFIGTVVKVNDEAEFTPKNVQTRSERERLVYGVKVSFLGSNDDEVLKPGMTVEVELPKE